jgi:hypothetical protein
MNLDILLGLMCTFAVIDHWVGGFALARSEKSRQLANRGVKNVFYDTRAIPYSIGGSIIFGAAFEIVGFNVLALVAGATAIAGYIYFRQRSHNPVFYALHGLAFESQGNKFVNSVVAFFTKWDTPDRGPELTEDERYTFGRVWGRFYGFIGLVPLALLVFVFSAFDWFALLIPFLGILFGDIHYQLGSRGRFKRNNFSRSWAEIATGGLIIGPAVFLALSIIKGVL